MVAGVRTTASRAAKIKNMARTSVPGVSAMDVAALGQDGPIISRRSDYGFRLTSHTAIFFFKPNHIPPALRSSLNTCGNANCA
jgi:hypothetical protein